MVTISQGSEHGSWQWALFLHKTPFTGSEGLLCMIQAQVREFKQRALWSFSVWFPPPMLIRDTKITGKRCRGTISFLQDGSRCLLRTRWTVLQNGVVFSAGYKADLENGGKKKKKRNNSVNNQICGKKSQPKCLPHECCPHLQQKSS